MSAKKVIRFLGCIAFVGVLFVAAYLQRELGQLSRLTRVYSNQTVVTDWDNVIFGGEHYGRMALLTDYPTIRHPKFELEVPDETMGDEIVGVIVAGRAVAFPLEHLSGPSRHLVGFSFNDVDYAVSHCDISGCTRVFKQAENGTTPHQLFVGGIQVDGRMVLLLDETRYVQDSASIPLPDVDYETTTLQEWKTRHPASLVYQGETEGSAGVLPTAP